MFTISANANPNYLAKIVEVKNLRKHPNADKLQVFTVDGNNVITGLDAREGEIGVYFPLECAINPAFLAITNSFREPERNQNKNEKGFFEYHGRVKAIKLRGEKSEGYYVPIEAFCDALVLESTDIPAVGTEFDTVIPLILVTKYRPKGLTNRERKEGTSKGVKQQSILIENQFRLHEDTEQLGKNMHKVSPDGIITITYKLHGTSFVSSNILCKRKLTWKDKIAKLFGVKVVEEEYANIYSSRKVIKNDKRTLLGKKNPDERWAIQSTSSKKRLVEAFYLSKHSSAINEELYRKIFSLTNKDNRIFTFDYLESFEGMVGFKAYVCSVVYKENFNHYYGYDLWAEINDKIKDVLPKGVTVYGEAVGFTKDGAYIQKDYDYGCEPSKETTGRMKLFIYRVTYTSTEGKVFEFSWTQMKEFCAKYGLNSVPLLYHGKAKDLFPINTEHHWHDTFLEKLKENYLEKNCWMCSKKVPLEGLCLRIDKGEIESYKLKSFRFLEKESKDLDNEEISLEDTESNPTFA